jgi:hypothetical protein
MAPPPRADRSLAEALAEVRWDFAGKPPVSPLSPAADYFADFPWDAGPRPARPAPPVRPTTRRDGDSPE